VRFHTDISHNWHRSAALALQYKGSVTRLSRKRGGRGAVGVPQKKGVIPGKKSAWRILKDFIPASRKTMQLGVLVGASVAFSFLFLL